MTRLEAAAAAYRAAHHALATAHAKALAASQAYTDATALARNLDGYHGAAWVAARKAKDAMRARWAAVQKAAHAEQDAKDELAQAALDAAATLTLDLEEVA